MDIVTDKCSYELYVKRRNPKAAELVTKYYRKYPILTSIRNRFEIYSKTYNQHNLVDELSREKINLLPYIFTFNINPKDRILYIYESFLNQYNTSTKYMKSSSSSPPPLNFVSAGQLWSDVLVPLTTEVRDDCYKMDVFVKILPTLIFSMKDATRFLKEVKPDLYSNSLVDT